MKRSRKAKPRPLWVVYGRDDRPLQIFGGIAAWPNPGQAIADARGRCGCNVVRYVPDVRR